MIKKILQLLFTVKSTKEKSIKENKEYNFLQKCLMEPGEKQFFVASKKRSFILLQK